MSSFIQKIRKASISRSTFTFHPKHLQSAEFMQNNVIYSRYVVPTDKFNITPVLDGVCAALTNPSFINTQYHIRAFYVPHSLVWKRFDDFVNGNYTVINGQHINSGVPYVTDVNLTSLMISHSHTPVTLTSTDLNTTDYSHTYDFILQVGSDAFEAYTLNNLGRYYYKLLRSLGYKFNFTNDVTKSDKMNAFPLLSYMKVFLDYFVPSQFYNTSACHLLLSKVYESTETFNVSNDELFDDVFSELFECYYPSDLITSSWKQPQSPLGSGSDNIYSQLGSINDIGQILSDTNGSQITFQNSSINGVQSSSVTTVATGASNLQVTTNPWIQRNLQKIADWLTRSRFTGNDKLINILARFGVKPDNELSLRSRMVGHFTQDLSVHDVTAMAGTEENALGEYAGKMFAQSENPRTFRFNCDDYGCIIITSMITPHDIDYFEGIDRDICKLSPMDWFQPEFDSMGTQLQSRRELISGITFDIPQTGLSQFVFSKANGYVPRYGEYKDDKCNVSGDFAVNSLSNGYDSYHHFRSLFKLGKAYVQPSGTTVYRCNSLVPNTGPQADTQSISLAQDPTKIGAQSNLLIKAIDKGQYNRIFNVQNNTIDHIYTMYYFQIVASRPMKSIADSIDIEDGSNDKIDISKPVVENNK